MGKPDSAFIRLILRSPDIGDGWRAVSPMLTRLVEAKVTETPDLFETRDVGNQLHIRLSADGQIVSKYL